MKFISTRAQKSDDSEATLEEAVFSGSAYDGGLYMPEFIPKVSHETLASWKGLSYVEICKTILQLFVDEAEIPASDLNQIIDNSFQSGFDIKEIVPIVTVGSFKIAELWHGKSYAFKDLAMSVLAKVFEYFMNKRKRHINVLVATSGDTGSSAIEAVRGSALIDIFVMFPLKSCSEIQEKQMTSVTDSNVHVFGCEGKADDFDRIIYGCMVDKVFSKQHGLTSMNSQNIIRILVQVAHYFYTYVNSGINTGTKLSVVVPSGGLGNVSGGVIAQAMGLPIKIISAVNINGTVPEVVRTGILEKSGTMMAKTSSISMDIKEPVNFERLFYIYSGCNPTTVSKIMDSYKRHGKVMLPSSLVETMRKNFAAITVPESDVDEVIRQCWQGYNCHMEPHTAVGVALGMFKEKYGVLDPDSPVVYLGCASPAKFPEVFERLGIPYSLPAEQQALLSKPTQFKKMLKGENWSEMLRNAIIGKL